MATDAARHTGQFSLDEELRRERSRQRGLGVTSYQFAPVNREWSAELADPL